MEPLTNSGRTAMLFPGANVTNNGEMHITVNDSNDHLHLMDDVIAPKAILNPTKLGDLKNIIDFTEVPLPRAIKDMRVDWGAYRLFGREDGLFLPPTFLETAASFSWRRWPSNKPPWGHTIISLAIEDYCTENKNSMANFSFSCKDISRNNSTPIAATLILQLMDQFPDLKARINDILGSNRHIFRKSLQEQITKLIDEPIRSLRKEAPNGEPILLLVDGLDECTPNGILDAAAKEQQLELLHVLDKLVKAPDSPFAVVVTSRRLPHIEAAMKRMGWHQSSINLDGEKPCGKPDNPRYESSTAPCPPSFRKQQCNWK